MNRLRLVLGDDSIRPEQLEGLFTVERTLERMLALEALTTYAKLLLQLVATSNQAELMEASNVFIASLGKVPGVNLKDSEARALGKAVVLLGGFFLEIQRAKAVREVVDLAHPHVMATINLVMRDFDPNSDYWSAGYRQVTLDLKGVALEARGNHRSEDLASKHVVESALTLSGENSSRFAEVSAQILETAERLREAQQNLRLVLMSREDGIQEILAYANRVHEFLSIYDLLRRGTR